MLNEEQNIAIAEACGWVKKTQLVDTWATDHQGSGDYRPVLTCVYVKDGKITLPRSISHYTDDLNAMHEAEKVLNTRQQDVFAACLGNLTGGWRIEDGAWQINATTKILFATAAQRAEAFLKALGKWSK